MARNKGELVRLVEKESLRTDLDAFEVGDTVEVHTRLREGEKERVQVFAGIVIGRHGGGAGATLTVRRMVGEEGVERIFPLHSPNIVNIKVRKRGKVRRARLNYLRGRTGRRATLASRRFTDAGPAAKDAPAAESEAPTAESEAPTAESEDAADAQAAGEREAGEEEGEG
jgi:large subunit ribosomal protein L19